MSVAADSFDECLLAELKTFAPELGVVLGSGFGDVADALEEVGECSFRELGGIATSTVPGHAGRFVWGELGERRVLLAQGRIHLYEGHGAREVTVLVRLMHAVGVRRLMLTNAAGALNADFGLGNLMVLSDHINLTGTSPLNGAEGFIGMVDAYSPAWREEIFQRAAQIGLGGSVHSGVYAGLRGPQYETPAEIGMLRTCGADAVGMSTVLETIQARALGMEVAGVSCLTNWAAGMPGASFDHADVVEVAKRAGRDLVKLLI